MVLLTVADDDIASRSGGDDLLDDSEDQGASEEKPLDASDLPVCEGIPKFVCCDDKEFVDKDDATFCGCT